MDKNLCHFVFLRDDLRPRPDYFANSSLGAGCQRNARGLMMIELPKIARLIRWLLVIPAGVLGFYGGVLLALGIYNLKERWCPSEYVVSGMCFAPWAHSVDAFAVALGSLVAGFLAVMLPTLAAPVRRESTAILAYVTGVLASSHWWWHGMWAPVLFAVFGGGLALWVCVGRHRRQRRAG